MTSSPKRTNTVKTNKKDDSDLPKFNISEIKGKAVNKVSG